MPPTPPVRCRLLAAVIALAATLPLAARAAPPAFDPGPVSTPAPFARLPDAPRGLVARGDGWLALLHDGRVVAVDGDGATRTLHRGWGGDDLLACGGRVLGLDRQGRLRTVSDGASARLGPRVSPHATPACLPDGGVVVPAADGRALLRLDASLEVAARAPLAVLPDAEPVRLRTGRVAVFAEPTFRYRHGVLGDEVEPAAVVVLRSDDLREVARWEAPSPFVLEGRRPEPFAFGGVVGVLVTRAGYGAGTRVLRLELRTSGGGEALVVTGQARAEGSPAWTHVFAAHADRAFGVAGPHDDGLLVRLEVAAPGPRLPVRVHDLALSSHRLGQRELDLARLLPRTRRDGAGVDRLLLPTLAGDAVVWLRCDRSACTRERRVPVPGGVSGAAPVLGRREQARFAVVSGADGSLRRLVVPGDPPPAAAE